MVDWFAALLIAFKRLPDSFRTIHHAPGSLFRPSGSCELALRSGYEGLRFRDNAPILPLKGRESLAKVFPFGKVGLTFLNDL